MTPNEEQRIENELADMDESLDDLYHICSSQSASIYTIKRILEVKDRQIMELQSDLQDTRVNCTLMFIGVVAVLIALVFRVGL